jgi:hypothetical protein
MLTRVQTIGVLERLLLEVAGTEQRITYIEAPKHPSELNHRVVSEVHRCAQLFAEVGILLMTLALMYVGNLG